MYTTGHSRFRRLHRLSLALAGAWLFAFAQASWGAQSDPANQSEQSDVVTTQMTVVPEPATLIFFGAAATALFRRRWTQGLR